MGHRVFADVTVGETIDCGTNTATREEIIAFGEQFDPLVIHTDPGGAADSPFGDVIASGLHTFALTQPPVVKYLGDKPRGFAVLGQHRTRRRI